MSLPTVTPLTRRQCCARLLTLLGGLAATRCATMSPQKERELGGEAAEEVEKTIGLVRDRRLVDYIATIGKRLAQVTGRSDVAWQWNVADDGEANAFALPGGYVYVTRGLLALSNREDEVAGVVAHEMAHVLERHAAGRVSAATPLAVLFGVPSSILGIVSPSLGEIVGGAGRVVSGLTLAPYSREQENEADRVGIGLAARAGWDASALATFLATIERAESLTAGQPRGSSFFATHPSTPDRVANIQKHVAGLSKSPAAPIAAGRAAYLGRLDGMVVGDSAAHGVFVGPLFLHPDLDVALQMPAGWKTANRAEAAGAIAPGEGALVLLQLSAEGDDPVAGARADGLSEAQVGRLRRLQISGLPAAALAGSTRDGTRVALTWIAHRKHVFRVAGICKAGDWEKHGKEIEGTAPTFRPLRAGEAARILESRLRIRPARAGENVAQVLARGGAAWSPAQAAVANGVTPDRQLERDFPVKVAVAEAYRPAAGR